ncbi:coiled-coil domain-containing protein 115 [Sabethes cyaneus]|uniref:coiled-coil domain-containing protein 115 n=1 Tax=Sabethes cyaneus TaxID=53552 RepID=UPI00237E88ED|nr:coiled-coil domain-containing protein 115 [Sabethes cyaneus]
MFSNSTMPETREEVCLLMDELLIRSLELVEQEVKLKTTIEAITNEGRLNLAQTRYHKGPNSVSSVQLPTEDYKEFNALNTVTESKDDEGITKLKLEQHPVDKDNGYIDPIRWFGVLIPPTLQDARKKFTRSVEFVVECANVQIELRSILLKFEELNKMKNNM